MTWRPLLAQFRTHRDTLEATALVGAHEGDTAEQLTRNYGMLVEAAVGPVRMEEVFGDSTPTAPIGSADSAAFARSALKLGAASLRSAEGLSGEPALRAHQRAARFALISDQLLPTDAAKVLSSYALMKVVTTSMGRNAVDRVCTRDLYLASLHVARLSMLEDYDARDTVLTSKLSQAMTMAEQTPPSC
jgi:hypothetical protein